MNHKSLKTRSHVRGGTLVETALVLMILFATIFGIFEFGMTAVRQNILDEATHRLARAGAIRGEDSLLGQWGPEAISSTLDAQADLLAEVGPAVYMLDAGRVNVELSWEDNLATTNSELTVVMTCDQPLLLGTLWGMDSILLSSRAVERIE
ncbi:TadE/TadG family type IV pilus assembly protein [Bremerella sp. JC770]|uniref:TadE/TadG family type IV pilus assembly protein n=1 Tax=Bremerella sp. JC770 TaxID=3232137 RepID=UPI0034591AD1